MKGTLLVNLILWSSLLLGQTPQVPSRMTFANIDLKINESTRKEIQKDVDLLTKSQKYFEIKAERARTYFPIIERIFKEEGVPDDFKYLVLQESALISDAVSSAQAVGFWQFKDFTALELGLRVDRTVDERMNIVSSTYGAARYLKKANAGFDNWLNALQSYQMGIGGATKALGDKYKGARQMTINSSTYWYVRKYLAHKVAFEGIMNKPALSPVTEFIHGSGKTLAEVARETGKDAEQIKELNKWLIKGKIPSDRTYTVILPGNYTAIQDQVNNTVVKTIDVQKGPLPAGNSKRFPEILDSRYKNHKYVIGVNGLPGIIASNTDNAQTLATKGSIPLSRFMEYNDLSKNTAIRPGQVYYLKRKKAKAGTHYHTLQKGETLWDVSQKYGIRMDKIVTKNRMSSLNDAKPGRVLWLRYIRPKDYPVEYSRIEETSPVTDEIGAEVSEAITKTNISESKPLEVNEQSKEETVITKDTDTEIEEEEDEDEDEMVYSTEGKTRKIHAVTKGETFYSISTRYGIPVQALLQWNKLEISSTLSIGQQLIVFVPSSNDKYITHKVQPGETMYRIASQYGVTVDQILKWNEKLDYHLKVGEILKIIK